MRLTTTLLAFLIFCAVSSSTSFAGEPFRCYADETPVADEDRPGEPQGMCIPKSRVASVGGGHKGGGVTGWRHNVPSSTDGMYRCTADGAPASDSTPQKGLGWCQE